MPSFLENLRPFYGTNEKNAAGESLEEFLEHYDPYKYRTPSCTTDAVIFLAPEHLTKELKGMRVLLVKRSNHPSIGFWALPGGFIEMRENLDDTARRELLEETSVNGLVMEQIGTYGDYDRDPRTRVITTAYMAVLQGEERQVRAGDDAAHGGAKLALNLPAPLFSPPYKYHFCAFPDKRLRTCSPDTGCSARDNTHLIFQSFRHDFFPPRPFLFRF